MNPNGPLVCGGPFVNVVAMKMNVILLAILLGAIACSKDGGITPTPVVNPTTFEFRKRTFQLGGNTLPYQILFPRGYGNGTTTYPLVIFLHGAGERGSDNERQMIFGSETFLAASEEYPAVVIFPQCPSDVMWSRRLKYVNNQGVLTFEFPVESEPNYAMEMVIALVRKMVDEEAIDPKRIYVTGLSMGGIGSFEFCYYAPDLPAAAISIAGGHDSTLVSSYAQDIAFRLYHGSADGVVPARYSRQMYDGLTNQGFQAEYFEAPGRGHEWNYVFDDPDYIEWMFSISRP